MISADAFPVLEVFIPAVEKLAEPARKVGAAIIRNEDVRFTALSVIPLTCKLGKRSNPHSSTTEYHRAAVAYLRHWL